MEEFCRCGARDMVSQTLQNNGLCGCHKTWRISNMDFLRWSLWTATGNTTYAIELVGGSNVKPQLCDGDHTSGKALYLSSYAGVRQSLQTLYLLTPSPPGFLSVLGWTSFNDCFGTRLVLSYCFISCSFYQQTLDVAVNHARCGSRLHFCCCFNHEPSTTVCMFINKSCY